MYVYCLYILIIGTEFHYDIIIVIYKWEIYGMIYIEQIYKSQETHRIKLKKKSIFIIFLQ